MTEVFYMKKLILLLAAVMLMAGCLTACGSDSKETAAAQDTSASGAANGKKQLQIVTTIFPEYDWVKNILGDNPGGAELKMLLDNGVDLHSYQPTAEDILKISTCDLFIYVGGESDKWVADALKEATNKDMIVINLLEVLGDSVKEEELVEGMEGEEEEEEEGEEEGPEYDEHVWLSVKNAEIFVNAISDAIQKLDADNAEAYKKSTSEYLDKLKALDGEYSKAVSGSSIKTLLFGDRFPFRYLVDDYGLSYYAAFVGCSAETEASFETIIFLAEKIDELSLHSVLTIEGSNQRIAQTIVQNTKSKDQKILSVNSMQSTTTRDVEGGATYLSIMEKNLEVLKEALQ